MGNQEIIDSCVDQCTTELFAAYGVELGASGRDHTADIGYAAVIGFTGESLRGTLLLAPARSIVERSQASAGISDRDWVGELANQLLGRIKNALLRYGAEIFVTTPLVLRGEHIAPSPRGGLKPHVFDGVSVWFDADIINGVELVEGAGGDDVAAAEGEAFLF